MLAVAFGCKESNNEFIENNGIEGNWRVYESGYSPGAGYVVDEVSANPLKFVRFGEDQRFESNYEGFTDINYYKITEESQQPVLWLYQEEPQGELRVDDELVYKYFVSQENNKLKLSYAYCIEGCHIGLSRLE